MAHFFQLEASGFPSAPVKLVRTLDDIGKNIQVYTVTSRGILPLGGWRRPRLITPTPAPARASSTRSTPWLGVDESH